MSKKEHEQAPRVLIFDRLEHRGTHGKRSGKNQSCEMEDKRHTPNVGSSVELQRANILRVNLASH